MKIYTKHGRLIYEGQVDDNSYMSEAIMDAHNLTLYFETAEHLEIPVGAYCEFQGERYTLMRPENLKMAHRRSYSYTAVMESERAKAKIWKFRNPVDGRLKFSLTAKPKEHLQMVVDELNRREGGWTVGSCIDDVEHTISYDHNYIMEALAAQAEEFKTEYEFKNKTVSLRKVEYDKSNPLPMSYGCGNGFKSGVGRSNESDNPPVEILYVQGGEENIDPSSYGNRALLLPKNGTIAYDGDKFENEQGFNVANARTYMVSEDRLSIRRSDIGLDTLSEDSLDCSDVFPKRVGTISEVVVEDADKHFYDIVDSSIPQTLNFEDCLIAGETMSIKFQTGMLAGREFDVKYVHTADSKTGKKGRRFEIVPQEIDGETMPNETYKPAVGNTYAVFKCRLPDAYIADSETKTGAEWDMFKSAVKYKYEHEDEKFTFSGTMDGLWSKKDWENIGGRIGVGHYILFSDNTFQKNGARVRITAVKQYINNPHSPEITLSNATISGSVRGTLKELAAQEVVLQETRKDLISFTKRRFRDAQETTGMLDELVKNNFDVLMTQFTESIQPISVQTMQMLVGDERLQFRYVTSDVNPSTTSDGITYDKANKQLVCPARIVQHLTLGITSISSSHKDSEYKFWGVKAFTSAKLDNAEKKYYLFISVPENPSTGDGTYSLSETPKNFKTGSTYNLLVGILNSEYDGERSFVTLYGFTEILPSRITTDKVISADGNSFFDMVGNAMKLGNALDFNTNGDGRLRLKGTLVQSQSGDVSPIGCFRGEYNNQTTYFNGDEVKYTFNGTTSTYMMKGDVPITGIAPTNTSFWSVTASGGKDGTSITIKGTADGVYETKSAFTAAALTSGTYLIKKDESTGNFHVVAKMSGSSWVYTEAQLGDGYIDAEGYLWISVDEGWQNVGKIKGENGEDGNDGKDGVSFTGCDNYYQWHNSQTTAPTGTWNKNVVPTKPSDTTYRYLWNYEVIHKSNGDDISTTKHVISADGKGIKSTVEYYMLTYNSTEPKADNGNWAINKQLPTDSNPYLWNKEVVTYNDNTTSVTIHLLCQKGKDGKDGDDGADGGSTDMRFQRNGSTTIPPTLDKTAKEPSGWSTSTPAQGLGWYIWMTKARKDGKGNLLENWSDPIRITPCDGRDGEDGKNGETVSAIYRGRFDPNKTYYGNKLRLDITKYGTAYYITQITAGEFKGADFVPTNTAKWNSFGASFDSVATDLLLAENANVAGWIFKNGKLMSENGSAWLDGVNGKMRMDGTIQQGTAYKGTFTDANIFYLPKITNYLWKYERVNFSDGTYQTTTKHALNSDGQSFQTDNEYYMLTSSATAPSSSDSGWTTTKTMPTDSAPYMWNKEVITYTDGSKETSVHLIVKKEAKTISSVDNYYQWGTSGLSAPTGTWTYGSIPTQPAEPTSKDIGLTYETSDIGKICRFVNDTARGGAYYVVYIYEEIYIDKDEQGNSFTSLGRRVGYRLYPQECIEFTCFEKSPKRGYNFGMSWKCTNRYTTNEWQQEACVGRFPRILATGEVTGTNSTAYISGEFHDGRALTAVFSVSRVTTGKYRITFKEGTLPEGYMVFVCASTQTYGQANPNKAGLDSRGSTNFVVSLSDDSTRNDGSFSFIIFSPKWSYQQSWD